MTGLGHDLPIEPNADEWLFWVGLSHPDEADLTTAVLAIGAAQALKITKQTAASGRERKILNQVCWTLRWPNARHDNCLRWGGARNTLEMTSSASASNQRPWLSTIR